MVAQPPPTRFYRTTRSDCKIAGVCGGAAKYLNLDPALVRILWIIAAFMGWGLIAYAVFWIAAPSEDTLNPPLQPPGAVVR